MSQNEKTITVSKKAARKKQIAVWNRRLAWLTLVVLVLMNLFVYGDYFGWLQGLRTPSIVFSMLFLLLLLIHSFFAVFLFGFPKFKWQIRVIHIYIGYFLFVFTFLSQSIIGFEPYHIIAYTLNWLLIVAHVALSIRFMLKRNWKHQPEPSLNFRNKSQDSA